MSPAPRALVAAAAAVTAAGAALALVGGWRTGVSWDETYHVVRLHTWLAHGWYLLDGDLGADGEPGSWVAQRHVYAPVTMLVLHGWGLLWGTDAPGAVATTARAFAVRHLGVAVIALVGVAATAGLARLLLGRAARGWGLVAAAVLVVVPTWTGHAMMNVKDVPVATGYTLVTLGVALACVGTARRAVGAGAVLVALGLLLAVGTRPGIAPGLVLAGLLGTVVLLSRRRVAAAAVLVASALLAVGGLALLYPAALGNPVSGLWLAATESSSFDERPGRWWYLPLFLGVELPTVLVLLGLLSTAVLVAGWRRGATRTGTDRVVAALVLLQTFALPALAVARQSNVYTGIRQLLFATPGLAVLVTVALAWLWTRRAHATGPVRWAAPVVTALALGLPLAAQVQLFPYSYAARSVPAAVLGPVVAGDDRDLELQTDYWRTSVRELAQDVPAAGWLTCTPQIDADGRFLPRSDESRADCADDPIGPLRPWADERRADAVGAGSFAAVDAGSTFTGAGCTTVGEVVRRLWWQRLVMSTVSRCPLVPASYPAAELAAGVPLDGAGRGVDLLHGPWSVLRREPGVGLPAGASGQLALRVPAAWRGRPLEVGGRVLDGSGLGAAPDGTWRRVLPAYAVDPAGRLVLELTNAGPRTARLLDLQVRPAPLAPPTPDDRQDPS